MRLMRTGGIGHNCCACNTGFGHAGVFRILMTSAFFLYSGSEDVVGITSLLHPDEPCFNACIIAVIERKVRMSMLPWICVHHQGGVRGFIY